MINSLLRRLAAWLSPPPRPDFSAPSLLRWRNPTAADLLAELRDTAWTCATINAAPCAGLPPRLYVRTWAGQPPPRAATRAAPHMKAAERVEEVTSHPLLDLLRQVNSQHNAFDLWELTTLYQEVVGVAYWLLEFG